MYIDSYHSTKNCMLKVRCDSDVDLQTFIRYNDSFVDVNNKYTV